MNHFVFSAKGICSVADRWSINDYLLRDIPVGMTHHVIDLCVLTQSHGPLSFMSHTNEFLISTVACALWCEFCYVMRI